MTQHKDEPKSSDEARHEKSKDEAKVTDATDQVDAAVAEENDKGFRGVEADETPTENYTVEGVLAGKPTPETDPKQADEVGSRKFQS